MSSVLTIEYSPVALRQLAEAVAGSYDWGMFVVYAIYNQLADKIYVGQTVALKTRIVEHNNHTYPKSYIARYPGEWEILYKEEFSTRKVALKREKQLKSFRGRQFLKSNIPR